MTIVPLRFLARKVKFLNQKKIWRRRVEVEIAVRLNKSHGIAVLPSPLKLIWSQLELNEMENYDFPTAAWRCCPYFSGYSKASARFFHFLTMEERTRI